MATIGKAVNLKYAKTDLLDHQVEDLQAVAVLEVVSAEDLVAEAVTVVAAAMEAVTVDEEVTEVVTEDLQVAASTIPMLPLLVVHHRTLSLIMPHLEESQAS